MPDASSSRVDSFSPKTTSVRYPWPPEVTGIERIALAAQGDLQRVLSAFFAHPITVALVSSQTSSLPEIITQPIPFLIASASPTSPITQTRQVHLQCAGKIVCTATSTVRITSPDIAHLFLQEKYAIGQMFRRLEKVPAFELVNVGLGDVVGQQTISKRSQLWRKYTLSIPHFECEILEVFPDRRMFVDGDRWLTGTTQNRLVPELVDKTGDVNTAVYQGIKPILVGVVLLMVSFELWRLSWARSIC